MAPGLIAHRRRPQSLLTQASPRLAACCREIPGHEGDVEQARRRPRDARAGGAARSQARRRRGAARRQGLRRQLSRPPDHRGPLPVQAASGRSRRAARSPASSRRWVRASRSSSRATASSAPRSPAAWPRSWCWRPTAASPCPPPCRSTRRARWCSPTAPPSTRSRTAASSKRGETLLVLGAAGGVGVSAVELGKAYGARVIAAVSSRGEAGVRQEARRRRRRRLSAGPLRQGRRQGAGRPLQEGLRRERRRRHLRSRRRRLFGGRAARHRLGGPPAGGRLPGRHPQAAAQPDAAQVLPGGRRVLGRLHAPRSARPTPPTSPS